MVRYEVVQAVAAAVARRRPVAHADAMVVAAQALDVLLSGLDCRDVSISPDVGRIALKAAQTYGEAVGHPAQLSLGDCFAYACAKAYRLTLLYKGGGFAQTDLA